MYTISIYICIYIYICICIYIYILSRIVLGWVAFALLRLHSNGGDTQARAYVYICIYIHTYIYIYIHYYLCVYIYILSRIVLGWVAFWLLRLRSSGGDTQARLCIYVYIDR